MNCCMLLSLPVDGRAWGLVEVYDMRLRRFGREEQAIAEFLVAMAARPSKQSATRRGPVAVCRSSVCPGLVSWRKTGIRSRGVRSREDPCRRPLRGRRRPTFHIQALRDFGRSDRLEVRAATWIPGIRRRPDP